MNVRALFFGPLVDITGRGATDLALPDGATVQSLLDAIFLKWPGLRAWDANLLIAVNLTYAPRDEIIPPGGEVAVMPPVQGG